MNSTIHQGNNQLELEQIMNNSVNAVITDPPYGISYQGKSWDKALPDPLIWQQCYRTLKPGGFLLSFASRRLYAENTINIKQAGFEVRDMLAWIYGDGHVTAKKHKDNKELATSLKPAFDPILLAMKPLAEGTFDANYTQHGTGYLQIAKTRIAANDNEPQSKNAHPNGRYPANVAHDGSGQAVAEFPLTSGLSAARYFYCGKSSPAERSLNGQCAPHPTAKPIQLMRWLVRLVSEPGGLILDPYMGSGSTGVAAKLEGRDFIGIEQDPEYFATAQQRIAAA